MEKTDIVKKMQPFKPKPIAAERSHWHKLEADFHKQGKNLKKGMPADYYKHVKWND